MPPQQPPRPGGVEVATASVLLYVLATIGVVWVESKHSYWLENNFFYQRLKHTYEPDKFVWGVLFQTAMFTYTFSSLASSSLKAFSEGVDNDHPRSQTARMTGVAARAAAAHTNAIETFPLLVAGVVVGRIFKVPMRFQMHFTAMHYLLRLIHWFAYILQLSTLRSYAWIASVVCIYFIFAFALIPDFANTYAALASMTLSQLFKSPLKLLGL